MTGAAAGNHGNRPEGRDPRRPPTRTDIGGTRRKRYRRATQTDIGIETGSIQAPSKRYGKQCITLKWGARLMPISAGLTPMPISEGGGKEADIGKTADPARKTDIGVRAAIGTAPPISGKGTPPAAIRGAGRSMHASAGGHFLRSSSRGCAGSSAISARPSRRPVQKGKGKRGTRRQQGKPSHPKQETPEKTDPDHIRRPSTRQIQTTSEKPRKPPEEPPIQKTPATLRRRWASCTSLRNSAEIGGIPRK